MRTKQVFPTNEVAHIWAKQSQSEGRNSHGNLFFRGDSIFSYGSHFCIAKILTNGKVLLTNRGYSNTTSKHIWKVRSAISHMEIIECGYPESFDTSIVRFKDEFKEQFTIIETPRKREVTKATAKQELLNIVSNVDKYLDAIGKTLTEIDNVDFLAYYNSAKSQDITNLKSELERIEKERETVRQAKQLQAIKEAQPKIRKWLKGEKVQIPSVIETVYLRESVREFEVERTLIVETSKGARVDLDKAKILFDLIKSGRDIKGFDLDGYTVIGLNGVLTIGCHKIERKEINRFAKKMNWGQIANH